MAFRELLEQHSWQWQIENSEYCQTRRGRFTPFRIFRTALLPDPRPAATFRRSIRSQYGGHLHSHLPIFTSSHNISPYLDRHHESERARRMHKRIGSDSSELDLAQECGFGVWLRILHWTIVSVTRGPLAGRRSQICNLITDRLKILSNGLSPSDRRTYGLEAEGGQYAKTSPNSISQIHRIPIFQYRRCLRAPDFIWRISSGSSGGFCLVAFIQWASSSNAHLVGLIYWDSSEELHLVGVHLPEFVWPTSSSKLAATHTVSRPFPIFVQVQSLSVF